jgi:hypothetical protein
MTVRTGFVGERLLGPEPHTVVKMSLQERSKLPCISEGEKGLKNPDYGKERITPPCSRSENHECRPEEDQISSMNF